MSDAPPNYLAAAFPSLARQIGRLKLADLPTPLVRRSVSAAGHSTSITIKRDDLTNRLYGGNKVRKLEYLLQRAVERGARRVATFGSVASHHALATALFARELGLGCTCLLSHQTRTPACASTLGLMLAYGAEIVWYGRRRRERIETMRRFVQGRSTWVIPMGGSSWVGTLGYVNAGLELAAQIEAGETDEPESVYVATGTLGTAVGLAIGLALAGIAAKVHAVRVSHPSIVNRDVLARLLGKTVAMMRHFDAEVPADLATRTKIRIRDEFFGPGYAKSTPEADRAMAAAETELGIRLETTYTAKAMAALLHDLGRRPGRNVLFWNTYNSRSLPELPITAPDVGSLPEEFLSYFD